MMGSNTQPGATTRERKALSCAAGDLVWSDCSDNEGWVELDEMDKATAGGLSIRMLTAMTAREKTIHNRANCTTLQNEGIITDLDLHIVKGSRDYVHSLT